MHSADARRQRSYWPGIMVDRGGKPIIAVHANILSLALAIFDCAAVKIFLHSSRTSSARCPGAGGGFPPLGGGAQGQTASTSASIASISTLDIKNESGWMTDGSGYFECLHFCPKFASNATKAFAL
jgi:hypothetical protein